MIDGRDVFDQPVKNNVMTSNSIRKIQLVEEMTALLVFY